MLHYTADFAKNFKKSYSYKMGGTQTVVFPNGQEFYFDDREYYSGRGAKYNSGVKHDNIGRVEVTKKDVAAALNLEKENLQRLKKIAAERKAAERRYFENSRKGLYGLKEYDYGTFVELSDQEVAEKRFNSEMLANTLNISIEDARLLRSEGKTYVFAKQINTGRIVELYHASLFCNSLYISVSYPSAERIAEFNHEEWASAPYSSQVGMTENKNHFVC